MNKGQSGMNAAVLIAIILGLIVLYVVFLPTADREKLLFNKSTSEREAEESENLLLREFPNRLEDIDDIDTKDIPNIFLFQKEESKELESINPFSIRNGVFDKKDKTISFGIEDIDNTDNVILTFATEKRKGTLIISLNDEVIYENDIESSTIDPIRLNKNLLDKANKLSFSVSSVGFKFWSTNEYQLEDIKIIADITDISRQKSQNIFTLTEEEFENIEKATLKFVPYCSRVSDVGKLTVEVNNRNVFSAIPVCDDPYRQVVPTGVLSEGENFIVFETNKGSYSIEQIEFEFDVEETKETVYYFEINDSNWEKIEDGDDVELRIEFVDDDEDKRADININGHLTQIDQEEKVYTRNIKTWVEEGNNYVKIIPKTVLEIRELKVEIVD